jgi:hypothetical protein
MSVPNDYFSTTFSDARGRFLSACLARGATVTTHSHPLLGPSGEHLCADVARIGPAKCDHVLFVTSATHGIEGYCGSGIQVGLLADPASAITTSKVALVLIHSVNPYGFAWTRRVNEDNVDLNRNFVDHAGGNYPENDLFEEVAEAMIPKRLDDESFAECEAILDAARERHGEVAIRKAMHKGQYRHPRNMSFGGNHATWSNRLLHEVCQSHLQSARTGSLIDLHSGLGPYGYGELMTPSKPGEMVFDLFHSWYGDEVHSTTAGASAYAGSKGSILAGFQPQVDGVRWAALGVEFGTRERSQVTGAVRADHWLDVHGDAQSAQAREIKRNLRDAFYVEEDAWKQKVWERGRDVVATAIARLQEE